MKTYLKLFLLIVVLMMPSVLAAQSEQTNELPPPMEVPPAVQQVQPTPIQPAQQANVTPAMPQPPQQAEQAVVVGRISEIASGELQRLVPGANGAEDSWVPVETGMPFGINDAIASAEGTKVEILFPNNTILRIGGNVQIQPTKLDAKSLEADVSAGAARFYNKGNATIKCETPVGYILGGPGSTFDVQVGENSAEVIAVNGSVEFYKDGNKYDVVASQVPILANKDMVTAGTARTDADWIAWNEQQDNAWNTRMAKGTISKKYLPQSLHQEAATLEENGKWVSAEYEGQKRVFWRPTVVAAGWQPYVNGHWVEYDGDNVWGAQ